MDSREKSSVGTGRFFLPAVASLTALYLALTWFAPAWLIGTPQYQWPTLRHGLLARLPAALAILALAVAVSTLLASGVEDVLKGSAGRARILIALFLLGLAFQLGPAAVHRLGLVEAPLRVYLPDHTSYFTDAAEIQTPGEWVRQFPGRVDAFATHTRTHPPGAVLAFYVLQRTMDQLPRTSRAYARLVPRSQEAMAKFELSPGRLAAGGLAALLLLVAAAATVPLTFAIGSVLAGQKQGAIAAILFASTPAFSHKTPMLDHGLAALILLALWLTVTAVSQRRPWRVVGAGVIIGAGLWLGTAVLAALPLLAIFAAAAIYVNRDEAVGYRQLVVLEASLMSLLVVTAVFVLFGIGAVIGSDFIEVYRAITNMGWEYNNRVSGRVSAWMWIAFNHYEMLAWAGVPLAAYFALAVFRAPGRLRADQTDAAAVWIVAIVAFLLALNFSGKVCYEASRLAWFCFPLLAIAAANALPELESKKHQTTLAIILALQAASALTFRMIF